MANAKMKEAVAVANALGSVAHTGIKKFVGAATAFERSKVKVADTLASVGIVSFMTLSPKTDEAKEVIHVIDGKEQTGLDIYKSFRVSVIAGMSVANRKLLDTPAAELKAVQKLEKRSLQQSIGSLIKDIRNSLLRLEGAFDSGPAEVRALEIRMVEIATGMIESIQRTDEPVFDAIDVIEKIRAVIAAVNA